MLTLIITGCTHNQYEIGDKDMDNQYEVEATGNEDLGPTRTPEELKAWTLEWNRNRGKNNLDHLTRRGGAFLRLMI